MPPKARHAPAPVPVKLLVEATLSAPPSEREGNVLWW